MAHSRAVSVLYLLEPVRMAHSRAVSVLYLLEPSRMAHSRVVSLPPPVRAYRIAHSGAVSVLYLLDPVEWPCEVKSKIDTLATKLYKPMLA